MSYIFKKTEGRKDIMKDILGTSNRYLEVNLSKKIYNEFKITEDYLKLYMSAKGLGLKLLSEKMDLQKDPFSEDNYLIFMTGVMMGTGAPCSGRWCCLTKSPLTGIIGTSSCGGPFGMALKTAGYDGLLITGKAEKPTYIVVTDNKVEFFDAEHLWGKTTSETQKDLNLSSNDGACVIGPAGENMVLYANIASGHRFLGRDGFGAVMGSKNLKAIVAKGGIYSIKPKNERLFNKVKNKAIKFINRNEFTSKAYRKFGTTYNLSICNKFGILPVNNFSFRFNENAKYVTGEAMAERYNSKPSTCKPCLILCGHKGGYPDGKTRQIPEYETTGLMGPNLGIYDPDIIGEWNELANEMGLDTISLGATLAYTMEATEKGLMKTDLKFGKSDNIADTIRNIAYKKDIGKELALSTKRLSEKYGGKEFAIHVKGLELAAYDPRGAWGQGLNYAVANRGGCHLSSFVVGIEVIFNYINPYSTYGKHVWVKFFEDLWAGVNSLHTCQFTGFAYMLEPFVAKWTPKFILSFAMNFMPNIAIALMDWFIFSDFFFSITGIRMNKWDFLKTGERIHILERYLNNKIGITKKDDTLPERFLKEDNSNYKRKAVVPLEKMLKKYYKIRGYNNDGIVDENILKKLKIL
ncbi:MAG TPA: aldehyde ferredoxin oxidoreductase family protein [Spirochaetota bacterium]|nr:aldehyde ferredoxin oxidoreductase family protein [Spirochaetota bacterium]